jgi:UDP-N-acetylmuramoyl-tripeptide--D-alanyl-D-alanine ligase
MNGTSVVALVFSLLFAALASLKWLRVAQREHYIAPWVTRIAGLWYRTRPINVVLAGVAVVLAVIVALPLPGKTFGWLILGAWMVSGVLALVLPLGLDIRGTTGKLGWTSRLERLTVVLAVLLLMFGFGFTFLIGWAGVPILVLAIPLITDLALMILAPIEKRLSRKYLVSAAKRLKQVAPKIVAITGSYGKTSTKGYVAHLLSGSFSVVASPASFNNLMGLARAVNDRVVPGTEFFVAEMGVYGRGEIRELSKTFPPDIAAITTIGEAHLARMGSREVIFEAKSEITEKAATVVLPIDEPELAGLAEKCRSQGKRVITVSTVPGTNADVVVDVGQSSVKVLEMGAYNTATVTIPAVGHAVNLAVAVGIAHALDIPLATLAKRLNDLPDAPHRAEIQDAPGGALVIDDTYNSNPVGAAKAVEAAANLAKERGGKLVVVTPGMVELGTVQRERNRALAASVAAAGGHLVVIGRTNRLALFEGAVHGPHPVTWHLRRKEAVQPALDQAGERGVILYENDLPDHYP